MTTFCSGFCRGWPCEVEIIVTDTYCLTVNPWSLTLVHQHHIVSDHNGRCMYACDVTWERHKAGVSYIWGQL